MLHLKFAGLTFSYPMSSIGRYPPSHPQAHSGAPSRRTPPIHNPADPRAHLTRPSTPHFPFAPPAHAILRDTAQVPSASTAGKEKTTQRTPSPPPLTSHPPPFSIPGNTAQIPEALAMKPSKAPSLPGPSTKIPFAELRFSVDGNNIVKLGTAVNDNDNDNAIPMKPKLKRLKLSFSHLSPDYPPIEPVSTSTSESGESAFDLARSVMFSFSDRSIAADAKLARCKPEFSPLEGTSLWRCPEPWCTSVYKFRSGLKNHILKRSEDLLWLWGMREKC